jgi:hypothetical protein
LLSTEIPIEAQRILVKIAGGENYSQLMLWLDGAVLITFEGRPYEYWLPLVEGEHQLFVTGFSLDGQSFRGPVTSFTVRADS